jgi:SAM-dependent methyltransferase
MRNESLGGLAGNRLVSPSAERNKEPVAQLLKELLPEHGVVLEVSSGTGQHAVHFAQRMPYLTWQPSERDEGCLLSIARWVKDQGLTNVRGPLHLNVMDRPWPIRSAVAVVCLNMIHIAPWPAAEGLVSGASEILNPGGLLYLYGPFRRDGHHTAASNEAFDRQLRTQNPEWGVRNLEDVADYARSHGFGPPEIHEMPANNLSVVLRRQ